MERGDAHLAQGGAVIADQPAGGRIAVQDPVGGRVQDQHRLGRGLEDASKIGGCRWQMPYFQAGLERWAWFEFQRPAHRHTKFRNLRKVVIGCARFCSRIWDCGRSSSHLRESGTDFALSWESPAVRDHNADRWPAQSGRRSMSTFDNPFDPKGALKSSGCSCGQHISQAEHERDAVRQLQCEPIEAPRSADDRYEGVVASAVMRAMFPKDAARRAFLKSVGASTALAAISQFFPLSTATEVFGAGRAAREERSQGRLHSDYLRDADHHGEADGLLREARAQCRRDQDRRLGGGPRQDHQQGIRRGAHAVADADRHHHGRRLKSDSLHDAGGGKHQRPGDHACR